MGLLKAVLVLLWAMLIPIIDKVQKRYLMSAMAHNLGTLMRNLFGMGTARSQQAEGSLGVVPYLALLNVTDLRPRTLRSRFLRIPHAQPTAHPVVALV